LDTGKLPGRIRGDEPGLIAEFEKAFYALLVVSLG
jgi:hypothetical protein